MLLFGIGSFGTGVYLTVPSVLLLFFMTDVLGMQPALAGIAVFVPRVYDVILDPIMGRISDRTRSRLGRRRPWLLGGAIASGALVIVLFSPPMIEDQQVLFWYVMIAYALSATSYTVFAVPYLAMPAEMTRDPETRTTLMAYRMGFAMAGIMAGSALTPWLVDVFGGGRIGFERMSWCIAAISSAAMLTAFFGTRGAADDHDPNALHAGIFDSLRTVASNRRFRSLGLVYFIQLTGLGCFNAAVAYFVIHALGRGESAIAVLFACVLCGSMVSMPLWIIAGRRLGKQGAYVAAAATIVIATSGFWLTSSDPPWTQILVLGALLGIGFGGAQMLPFSIVGDIIQQTAAGSAGTYTGVWTAIEKAGLAAGPLIVGLLLQISGFREGAAAGSQSAGAIEGVRAAISLFPAIFVALSIPALLSRSREKT